MAIKITKNKDGKTYDVRVWAKHKDARGKRATAYKSKINTLAVAKRWAERAEMELSSGEENYDKMTFRELYNKFKNRRQQLSQTTIAKNAYIDAELLNFFGNVKVPSINTPLTQEFVDYLVDRGNKNKKGCTLKESTVKIYISRLKSIINWGVGQGIVEYNRIKKLDYIEDDEPFEPTILEPEFIGKVLSYLKQYVYNIYIPVLIAVMCGARRGENLSIKTDAINFEEQYIDLKSNLVDVNGELIDKSKLKTKKSKRLISMSDFVKQEIYEHLKMNKALQPPLSDFVSANVFSGLPTPSYVTHTFHKVMLQVFNVDMRLHDLRACCNQMLYENDTDTTTRMSILGHTKEETNEEHYLKFSVKKTKNAMNTISEIVKNNFDTGMVEFKK